MNTTFDILVIVLSSLLGIFLIISITTAVLVYKLVKSVKLVVAKGEHLVDTAEQLGDVFKRNAGAVSLLKMLMKFVNKAK